MFAISYFWMFHFMEDEFHGHSNLDILFWTLDFRHFVPQSKKPGLGSWGKAVDGNVVAIMPIIFEST